MNPILQILQPMNNIKNAFNIARSMGDNPNVVIQQLKQSNPQFKSFCDEVEQSSIEDVARKYGINLKK